MSPMADMRFSWQERLLAPKQRTVSLFLSAQYKFYSSLKLISASLIICCRNRCNKTVLSCRTKCPALFCVCRGESHSCGPATGVNGEAEHNAVPGGLVSPRFGVDWERRRCVPDTRTGSVSSVSPFDTESTATSPTYHGIRVAVAEVHV